MGAEARTTPRPSGSRPRWGRLHRWLGLGLLGFWVVIGLSGSVLVVYRELLNAARPMPTTSLQPAAVHLDAVLHTLHASEPARGGPWRIELPLNPGDPVVARYLQPEETRHRAFAPLMVWLDTAGQRVHHAAFWGQEVWTWIYDLHYALLLDAPGRHAVGVLGVLMTVSLVSGLVLWWPRPGRWAQAWSFKRDASVERQVYDVHKLAGAGGAVLLLMLCLTGILLTWQRSLTPWLDRVSPMFQPPPAQVSGPPVVSLAQAVSVAQAVFPEAEPRWVESPPRAGGLIRVQLWQSGEPSRRFPRTQVWLDAATGDVVGVRNGQDQGAADTLLAWLHPLHNGEVAAWAGRLLILLTGVLPLVLGVTGIWRWQHKRRGRAHARRPRVAA